MQQGLCSVIAESFTYIRKIKGPRTEVGVIPIVSVAGIDLLPFTTTRKSLLVRKASIHRVIVVVTPKNDIFLINSLWLTVSKGPRGFGSSTQSLYLITTKRPVKLRSVSKKILRSSTII